MAIIELISVTIVSNHPSVINESFNLFNRLVDSKVVFTLQHLPYFV
jgi:hypothetical protein